jgi:hypothetical protein
MLYLEAVNWCASIGRNIDGRNHVGKAASRAKASGSTNTLRKLVDYENLGCIDLASIRGVHEIAEDRVTYSLNDQLCNPVAFVDGEVGLAEVEEQNLDRAAVVGVNDTGTNIN